MPKTGDVGGRHYTTFVDEVKVMKRQGRLAQAEALLLKLLAAAEAESREQGMTTPPWYAAQLEIVRRKLAKEA